MIMDQIVTFDAIMFPSDDRSPHMVKLMTSPVPGPPSQGGLPSRMPHPEVHMDYIPEGAGHRAWRYHVRRTKSTRTRTLLALLTNPPFPLLFIFPFFCLPFLAR